MLNYIWMGNLDSEIKKKCCSLGPKSLENFPDVTAKLWVPEVLIEQATALFDEHSNIKICSVDKMLNGEYGENSKLYRTKRSRVFCDYC